MTKQIQISEELRSEIIEAVENADLCCPEGCVDMAIAAAEMGADWRAEIADMKACDAEERKALGIDSK